MKPRLRAKVLRRARGRCEYCRTPFRFDFTPPEVDHIISAQHDGQTELSNLAAACAHCNSHKGPNIAGVDGLSRRVVRLFNPRTDRWEAHFTWAGAILTAKTAQGRVTIRLLSINDPAKTIARTALMDEGVF